MYVYSMITKKHGHQLFDGQIQSRQSETSINGSLMASNMWDKKE